MALLDLNNTFGALLLGTLISAILYGATCLQSWHYFQNYTDRPLVKFSVATLLLLESLHSAFSIHAIYYYVILNYANPLALREATWSVVAVLFVTCFITSIVHIFYAWRVYMVSKRNAPLALFIVILELVRFGAGITVSIRTLQIRVFSGFIDLPKVSTFAYLVLSLATAIDVIIAACLSFHLHFSKTGFSDTDKITNRLVVHAINNGILTGITDILCLVFGTAEKNNLIYLTIYQCIGNLYTNSMLSTLNTRASTRRPAPTSVELSGLASSSLPTYNLKMVEPSTMGEISAGKRESKDYAQGDKQAIEINVQTSKRLRSDSSKPYL